MELALYTRSNRDRSARRMTVWVGFQDEANLYRLFFLVLVGLCGFMLQMGCKEPKLEKCPTCPAGTTCNVDLGICEESVLTRFDSEMIPGRAVRIAIDGERVAVASIDPQSKSLLVGVVTPSSREFHVLQRFGRIDGKYLAMASSNDLVAVAWLEETGVYQIATRPRGANNQSWQAILVSEKTAESGTDAYQGSEEFDLSLDEQGGIHLVFQDSQLRTLRYLGRANESADWTSQTIDDGFSQVGPPVCSRERRQSVRLGVGVEPDIQSRGNELYVAYHDADCGDLRLARRVDQQWIVSVVDTGGVDVDTMRLHERGVVGRFPSLAFDSQGRIGLAYHDVSRGRVLFATARDGVFHMEEVDPGLERDESSQLQKQLVGAFTRLVFDDFDIPRVVYMNATNTHLRSAHRLQETNGQGRWLQRTLDARAPVGFFADQLYDPVLGHVVVAERLDINSGGRSIGGMTSELVLLWDGKP